MYPLHAAAAHGPSPREDGFPERHVVEASGSDPDRLCVLLPIDLQISTTDLTYSTETATSLQPFCDGLIALFLGSRPVVLVRPRPGQYNGLGR